MLDWRRPIYGWPLAAVLVGWLGPYPFTDHEGRFTTLALIAAGSGILLSIFLIERGRRAGCPLSRFRVVWTFVWVATALAFLIPALMLLCWSIGSGSNLSSGTWLLMPVLTGAWFGAPIALAIALPWAIWAGALLALAALRRTERVSP